MTDMSWLGKAKPVILARTYEQLIRNGTLPPGTSLSIRRIRAECQVGGHTAARAIRLLAEAGLVEVRTGRAGTLVRGREGTWNEQVRQTGRS